VDLSIKNGGSFHIVFCKRLPEGRLMLFRFVEETSSVGLFDIDIFRLKKAGDFNNFTTILGE
jgi:hypothetical protein